MQYDLAPLCERHGSLPVQRLSKAHIDDLVNDLVAGGTQTAKGRTRKPWSPSAVNKVITTIEQVLEDAKRQGIVPRNIAELVDRVPMGDGVVETYTEGRGRNYLGRYSWGSLESRLGARSIRPPTRRGGWPAIEVGEPYSPPVLSRYWRDRMNAAGVRHIKLHGARHTCATLMHFQQVPASIIAAWVGHKDATLTMKMYVHSQDDALKAAGATLNRGVTSCDTEVDRSNGSNSI